MNTTTYLVMPGDTLYSIAMRYGITVNELMMMNNLSSTMIYPNQQLLVPEEKEMFYITKEGDTIATLVTKFSIDPESIEEYSGLLNVKIVPNQKITVTEERVEVPGERLANILRQNNISAEELILNNPEWLENQFRV